MKKRLILVSAMTLALASAALAQGELPKMLADAGKAAENALVMIQCTYETNNVTARLLGMGVCYDAEKGEFLTFAFGSNIQPEKIKDLKLVIPGPEGKQIEGEFLGIRPEARIGFVRAKASYPWKAVRFAAQSSLKIGDPVVSVGLMPNDAANTPYCGAAYVSAKMRVPEDLYHVTGGRLTCIGSPVFGPDGLAIGIVSRQPFEEVQMATNRGTTNMALKSRQDSSFFTPVEEFGYVLTRIPRQGQVPRMPWMGVLQVVPIGEAQAEIIGKDRPAVAIDQVVPGTPADQAGLKSGDVVVGFDGKPLEKFATPELIAQDMMSKIMRMPVGETVKLTVLRSGKPEEISVKLVDMPLLPAEANRYANPQLGVAVREKVDLDQFLDKSPTARVPGLVIIGVGQREPAMEVEQGDLVTSVNGQPVTTAETFKQIVEESLNKDPNKAIMLTVRRGGAEPKAVNIQPMTPPAGQ